MNIKQWLSGGWRQSKYAVQREYGYGIDQDGWYGFQCKDFANAYAEFMGHPLTAGNAYTAWTAEQDPFWIKIPANEAFPLKTGDIVVHRPSAMNGNFGHIEIVDNDDGNMRQWHAIAQNWLNANSDHGSPPAGVLQNSINTPIYGVLRPKEVQVEPKITKSQIQVLWRQKYGIDAPQGAIDAYVGKHTWDKVLADVTGSDLYKQKIELAKAGKLDMSQFADYNIRNASGAAYPGVVTNFVKDKLVQARDAINNALSGR